MPIAPPVQAPPPAEPQAPPQVAQLAASDAGAGDATQELAREMAEVLRSLRMKGLKAPGQSELNPGGGIAPSHLSAVKVDDEVTHGVVDSGATAPLRQGTSREITERARVKVQLAKGKTELFILKVGALLSEACVQPILPMAALPALGCAIVWSDEGVNITRPVKGSLPVRLNGLCPELPKSVILQLIAEYELLQREQQNLTAKKMLWWEAVLAEPRVEPGEAAMRWLRQEVAQKGGTPEVQLKFLKHNVVAEVRRGYASDLCP